MLLQGPPVILSPADQLDEVAATKGQLEGGQLIEDAAQGPDVDLIAVALLAEDLGGDVVWSPTQGLLPFSVEVNFGGQTKVSYLAFHVVIEENIS